MKRILTPAFFNRPTLTIAREMLGKYLVRRRGSEELAMMITEVEAYDGPHDRASHASRGRTPRTSIMFGPAGHFYIYFTYGMHWLVNVVTGPKDYPAAVLIRGLAPVKGPARLTKLLDITGTLNGKPAARKTDLWLEDRGVAVKARDIARRKRVGVDYAGLIWKNKLYNFSLKPEALAALQNSARVP